MKVFCFLLGFILMVIGFFYMILYLNLITFGYSQTEYFSYLLTRYEFWYLPIGLTLITIALFRKGKKND